MLPLFSRLRLLYSRLNFHHPRNSIGDTHRSEEELDPPSRFSPPSLCHRRRHRLPCTIPLAPSQHIHTPSIVILSQPLIHISLLHGSPLGTSYTQSNADCIEQERLPLPPRRFSMRLTCSLLPSPLFSTPFSSHLGSRAPLRLRPLQ